MCPENQETSNREIGLLKSILLIRKVYWLITLKRTVEDIRNDFSALQSRNELSCPIYMDSIPDLTNIF